MEPPPEISGNDVEELAKLRAFNVGRTQLLDLMHDLTTPGKSENIKFRSTNGARGGPVEGAIAAIRHGSGRGVKEQSRNHELRASSNPLRNSKTGALSFSGKNLNSSLRTSERVATPLYNSGNKSRNNLSQFFIDTTVNRGKVLDFTKEQEQDKMRAEIALHHPRIPPPHQDRSQCTIFNTSSHLNLLAQPKRLPTESVKDNFETHPSGGHPLSATQWTSPLVSSLVLHKTEMESSGPHSTGDEEALTNKNEKFASTPSAKEKKRIELFAPPPRRSLARSSSSFSSVHRRHTSWSMVPEGFRGTKAHSPPVRPFTRHAHSCGPPQKTVPEVHSGVHSDMGGGGALPTTTFSVNPTATVSRSLRSMSSLLHITPAVVASNTRFSGVSRISKPSTVLALPPNNLQSNSKVLEAAWDKLPSKSEQVARRKFIQDVSQRGSSIKADKYEERVIVSNNHNHSNKNMVSSKETTENNGRSFCEATNSSFLSSSSYSAASSLLEVLDMKKQPTSSFQQHQSLDRNGGIFGRITPLLCDEESGVEETRLSDGHLLPQFPTHFERNGATLCEAVSSSNRTLCSRSDGIAIKSRAESHLDQPPNLVKKRDGETHELKDPVIKRIKKGCPKESYDNDGNLRNPEVRTIMVNSRTCSELKDGPLAGSGVRGDASSASADAGDSAHGMGVKIKDKNQEQMGVSLSASTKEVRGVPPGRHLDPVGQKVAHHCPRYTPLEDSGCEENTCGNIEGKKTETSLVRGLIEAQNLPQRGSILVKSQPVPSLEGDDEDKEDLIPDPPMRVVARRSRREAAQWPPPDMASSNDDNEEDIHFSTKSLLSKGNEGILSLSLVYDGLSANGSEAVVVVERRNKKKKS